MGNHSVGTRRLSSSNQFRTKLISWRLSPVCSTSFVGAHCNPSVGFLKRVVKELDASPLRDDRDLWVGKDYLFAQLGMAEHTTTELHEHRAGGADGRGTPLTSGFLLPGSWFAKVFSLPSNGDIAMSIFSGIREISGRDGDTFAIYLGCGRHIPSSALVPAGCDEITPSAPGA